MVRSITLGRTGLVALVDDADYKLVAEHRWGLRRHRKTAYAEEARSCCSRTSAVQMHRLVLNAAPDQQVDHVDGNGLNNTRANLRLATNSNNAANRRKQASSSQFKGVWFRRSRSTGPGTWAACVKQDGVRKYLGSFSSEEAAARAYDDGARRAFGAFAAVNFPEPGETAARRDHTPPRIPAGPLPPARERCNRGHEFTSANIYISPSGGRECRICKRRRSQESKQRKRETERQLAPIALSVPDLTPKK